MLRFCLIYCFFLSTCIYGQSVWSRVGARFALQEIYSNSDSGVTLPTWHPHVFSDGGGHVGAMNRYGLLSLSECLFAGGLPTSGGSLRWVGMLGGDGSYQQASAQISLIRSLGDRIRLGTGIGFSYAKISGYGARWVPVGSLALGGRVGSKMIWGFCWDNPQHLVVEKGWFSQSPMRIRAGISQLISTKLNVYGGLEWEPGVANGAMIRIAYRPSVDWRVELGSGWRPDQILLGVHRRMRRGWVGLCFSQEFALGESFYFGYSWAAIRKGYR